MKKIFLIILMMFCCINVSALECEVKEYGPFVYKDEVLDEYPFIDKNVYEYTSESDLSLTYENKEGRIINSYDGFHYLKKPLLNYIEIEALNNDAYLSDFLFFYDNKPIDYTSNMFDKINAGEKVKFKFDENLEIDKFYFIFKSLEEGASYKLNISFGNDDKVFSNIYMGVSNNSTIRLDAKLYPINLSNYDHFYSTEKLETDDSLKLMDEVKLYTYQDIKYRSYKIVNKCENHVFKNINISGSTNYNEKDEVIYKPVMTTLFAKPKETIKYKTPIKFTMQYKNSKPLQVSKTNVDFIKFSLLFILIFIITVIIIIKKHINKR